MKMEEKIYTIMKVGNRSEAEVLNQATEYALTGKLLDHDISPGKSVRIQDTRTGEWLTTSTIRSLYMHESDSGYDKIILPSDFPISKDLDIPEMKDGDLLIGTMNSVYFLTNERKDIQNNY